MIISLLSLVHSAKRRAASAVSTALRVPQCTRERGHQRERAGSRAQRCARRTKRMPIRLSARSPRCGVLPIALVPAARRSNLDRCAVAPAVSAPHRPLPTVYDATHSGAHEHAISIGPHLQRHRARSRMREQRSERQEARSRWSAEQDSPSTGTERCECDDRECISAHRAHSTVAAVRIDSAALRIRSVINSLALCLM